MITEFVKIFAIYSIYVIKLYVFGFYKHIIFDAIAFVMLLCLLATSLYKFISKKKSSDSRRLIVMKVITFLLITLITASNLNNKYHFTFENKFYMLPNVEEGLPWNVINEFDSGRNSNIINKEKTDMEVGSDNYFGSSDIIDGENYYVSIYWVNNVAFVSDGRKVTSSNVNKNIQEYSDIELLFDTSDSRDIKAVTVRNDVIYAMSVPEEDDEKYSLTLHNHNGEFIEGYDYDLKNYNAIKFMAFGGEGDIYLTAGYNIFSQNGTNPPNLDLIKINKNYELEVLNNFEDNYVSNIAVYEDNIILVNEITYVDKIGKYAHKSFSYKIYKLDLDGNVITEQIYKIPFTNYASSVRNVDINPDGKIYFIRYVNIGRETYIYNQEIRTNGLDEYVAIDVFDNNLKKIDTVYFNQDGMGEYSYFFQVKEEGNYYTIYSYNDILTIEPYDKNIWGAAVITLAVLAVYLTIAITLTEVIVKIMKLLSRKIIGSSE